MIFIGSWAGAATGAGGGGGVFSFFGSLGASVVGNVTVTFVC